MNGRSDAVNCSIVSIQHVGVTTVLKAISRESYCGRPLISRNFGDSSEIVSMVS